METSAKRRPPSRTQKDDQESRCWSANVGFQLVIVPRDLHRLEREYQSLRQEVKLQLQAVGGMLYATHRGKPSDSDELLAKLQVIDGLEERAQALSAQAEALRRKGK